MRRTRITGAVAAGILIVGTLAAPGTAAQAAATCNFETVTIQGTEGADTLTGTSGPDVISAGGGDDTVLGLGGNDTVCLGQGNDTFDGGGGDDLVLAEPSIDGNDVLHGGAGVDTAVYPRTNRMILSLDGVANDGESGEHDNIGTDIEAVNGGDGSDTLIGNDGPNILRGNGGADQINGLGGNDDLFGNEGNDDFLPGPGDDQVSGGIGDDFFHSDATADGSDWFFGDQGSDTVEYRHRTASVFVTLDNVADDGALGEGDNMKDDVENIEGGQAGDLLEITHNGTTNGQYVNHTFSGGPGQDIIDVSGGSLFNELSDLADGGSDVDVCTVDVPFDRKINCEL